MRPDADGIKWIEGVPYRRHVVCFRLTDGSRRKLVFWSPGHPWVRDEVARELDYRHGADFIAPGSVTIRQEDPT